jgi:NAD-dependent DNA ligase
MADEQMSPWRLVARFDDAEQAAAASEELRAVFAARGSGDGASVPDVLAMGNVLAIHHPERGGFGDDAKKLLEAKDAEIGDEEMGMLTLSASFRLPMGKPGEQLGKELRALFDQGKTTPLLRDWKTTAPFGVELAQGEAKDAAASQEGSLFEMILPASPKAIDAIKKHLMGRKVEQLKLRLCAYEDLARLAKAQAQAAEQKPPPKAPDASGLPTVGKRFLFTGKLSSLSRDDGKKRVEWLGGIAAGAVSRELDYLVVGDDGSPLYGQGAKGSKIVAVEKLQAHGVPIKIISERDFSALKRR